jgi:putative ABC transport system permease protein
VVWRRRARIPTEFGNVVVMLVEPRELLGTAAWGRGPELARAREAVAQLAAADEQAGSDDRAEPLPALLVGRTELRPGQAASVDLDLTFFTTPLPIDVVDVLPAFPGADPRFPTVVTSIRLLDPLLADDPRYRPVPLPRGISLGGELRNDEAGFDVQVWSAGGADALDEVLAPSGVEPERTATLAQAEQEPTLAAARRGLGYQRALGICLAALAGLALCLYADRAAARGRAADLLLRRVGFGRAGAGRARTIELCLTGLAGLLLALAGVALVAPLADRLVDGSPGAVPALTFRPTAAGVAATVAAGLLAVALAAAVTAVRGRTGSDGEVLRDAD